MNERKRAISGQLSTARPVKFARDRVVMLGKSRHDVSLDDTDEGLIVRFEKTGCARLCVSSWTPGLPVWNGAIDGERIRVQLRPILNGTHLAHGGFEADARVYTRREAELALLMPEKKTGSGSNFLRCPMPCLVKSISVAAGQRVRSGETLCIIEAMKMETAVCVEFDATVEKIYVQPGDSLAVDAIIMAFS
jgi:propionyl-CoA carboxylase alpha chain